MKKRFFCIFLSVLILCTGQTIRANAAGGVRSKIDEMIQIYPDGSVWTDNSFAGTGECYGFVQLVVHHVFGKADGYYRNWNYYGQDDTSMNGFTFIGSVTDYSEESIRELLKNAKVGDVLQFSPPRPHSMLIYSLDENYVGIYDCNWFDYLEVSVRKSPYGKWQGRNSTRLGLYRATNYAQVDGSASSQSPATTTPSSPTQEGEKYITTADHGLRLRSEPSTNGTQLGLIPYGTSVTVTKTSGGWGYTAYGGTSGWISLEYADRVDPAQNDLKGDINSDGMINSTDARLALRFAAQLESPTDKQIIYGDVNGDGKLNSTDARWILRYAAKLITSF